MEQRYQAVLAVVQDGWQVTEVARRLGVSRQSVHAWIARYEKGGLAALADRSHGPRSCPHQTGGRDPISPSKASEFGPARRAGKSRPPPRRDLAAGRLREAHAHDRQAREH